MGNFKLQIGDKAVETSFFCRVINSFNRVFNILGENNLDLSTGTVERLGVEGKGGKKKAQRKEAKGILRAAEAFAFRGCDLNDNIPMARIDKTLVWI